MVKVQCSKFNIDSYVLGVDGGGTKTAVALADAKSRIIARSISGISNPRNVGIEIASKNIAAGIYQILKGKRGISIASTFIGLPALEEEYKDKKSKIIFQLKNNKKISKIFKGKVDLGSDQLVAFRSGSDAKDGIVVIAGTGSAAHGWNGGQEVKVNGWGYLADEGSAFWIGQKTFQSILKSYDGRVPDTILEKVALKNLKLKNLENLINFVYTDPVKHIPMLFRICSDSADQGDKIAREILVSAGKELALSAREVASRLHFSAPVPMVLVGGAYLSSWVLDTIKEQIQRYYPEKFNFIIPKDPVLGAIKLALEINRK